MPKIHPIFGSSLLMLSVVFGVVLAVQYGWIAGGDIVLEMKIGKAEKRGAKINIPVHLTLKNPSGRAQAIQPQNICRTFRWFVLDERTAFIQSARGRKNCIAATLQRSLKPWEEAEETFVLPLDSARFEAGKGYFLIVKFWGFEAQAPFTAPY